MAEQIDLQRRNFLSDSFGYLASHGKHNPTETIPQDVAWTSPLKLDKLKILRKEGEGDKSKENIIHFQMSSSPPMAVQPSTDRSAPPYRRRGRERRMSTDPSGHTR